MARRSRSVRVYCIVIFTLALSVVSILNASAVAQGTPNCSYSGSPSLSVLAEYSKWTTNSNSNAGFYCNFNVGGGSAGMAVNIDYGCDAAIQERWDDILQDRQGQPGVTIGTLPPGTRSTHGNDYVLKRQSSEQGYTGYVGNFQNRDQIFVRASSTVIADVVILYSSSAITQAQLADVVNTLWLKNWSNTSVKCTFAKILNQGGNVQITRIAPEIVNDPSDLFEGDIVRLTRNSGDPCCPFIEIEWKPQGLYFEGLKGKAIFKGEDTFFDEFTIQRNRSDSFSVGTAGNPILEFGQQLGIGWIITKSFSGPFFGGIFLRPTLQSNTVGDLVFINMKSVVVINPISSNQAEVLTLEGSPEIMTSANGPGVTVNTGQRSVISSGSPSQAQAYDPNTIDRWFEPFVDVNIAPPTQQPPVQQPPTSGSATPQITGVQIPSSLSLNQAVSWNINFSDSDGDINWIRFEERVSGSWALSGEFDPEVLGLTSGSITISSTCSQSGQFEKRVRLFDASGNESPAYEYTMNCAGSGAPPGNTNTGGLAQFDNNSDCVMSDSEFFSATDSWIFEEIGNDLFFSAVDAWISQTSICTSAASSANGLRLHGVTLTQSSSGSVLFKADGQNIASTSVEVFDLNGNGIYADTRQGMSLSWNLRSKSGKRIANGIYLYRVNVKNTIGNLVYSEVRKLLVID